ncbi:MAG: hypothetical protein LAO24_13015 [Acidobacteriia bacterium]|nr:hypothetical protein [Terriglobia bacterium]
MGFTDDFSDCMNGKTLPPELANALPSPKAALAFAAQLVKGATVEEALIAVGVGAEAAAAVAAVVVAVAVGVIIGAVVGCALVAAGGSVGLGSILASMDSSDTDVLQGALADAGFNPSDVAAA